MSELSLTLAAPVVEKCPCCGGESTRLTRVVHADGAPHALYYATFTDEPHPEKHIAMIVSVGDFGDGSGPGDRDAFALNLRRTAHGANLRLMDATRCPWSSVAMLGNKLTEAEAKAHPRRPEAFAIARYAIRKDPPLGQFLSRVGGCSACGKSCGA